MKIRRTVYQEGLNVALIGAHSPQELLELIVGPEDMRRARSRGIQLELTFLEWDTLKGTQNLRIQAQGLEYRITMWQISWQPKKID